jgi:flagellar protein FlbD
MIELTRLNGHSMVVNSDLIKYVESSPDTMLTLIHGEKIVVTEPCEEVVRRITEYRTRLLADVLKQSSGDDLNTLAAASTRAGGLRIVAAQSASDEMPSMDDAAQQRRRRDW